MKNILQFLPLVLFLFITACNQEPPKLDYRVGSNGLIYESKSENLYTGRIIDTTEVIIEIEVVDGKKHGEFITYYLNGNIEKIGYIKENINEGEWNYYYEDGKLECTGHFKNDKPDGNWTFYHQNGIKKEEGSYSSGKRSGLWFFYDEKGEVTNEHDFDTGDIPKKEDINHSSLITSLK